jgi:hypothetical protein
LQQRDRDGQQSAALLFGVIEPAVELVCPVDDHISIMSSDLYKVKFISAGKDLAAGWSARHIASDRAAQKAVVFAVRSLELRVYAAPDRLLRVLERDLQLDALPDRERRARGGKFLH